MKFFLLFTSCIFFCLSVCAQIITGTVTDSTGNVLAYATIEASGTNNSTTTNNEGKFSMNVPTGVYTITCRHIGYQLQQKRVEVVPGTVNKVDFKLLQQQLLLPEVIIKKGEDPAYEIIRNTIKKRPVLKDEIGSFTTEVYTKGQMRLRDFPKKFMGQKVDFEDGDSSKKKMIFLSETVSKYAVEKGGKSKVEVVASKVSGQSDGFGLTAPQIISFYENNIQVGTNINPRGFVSPIADNALGFYNYKYEGAFFEEGKEISRIRVTPKRKFEPLFSGYLNIIENEWRIHSLQLLLLKSSGMELLDTLKIEQLYTPAENGTWVMKNQVLYPAIKMLGFDGYGSFVNVYSNYNLDPEFNKGFFTNTIIKYIDSSNKKPVEYWNENRPIVLQQEEIRDYQKKDSLEQLKKSPAYMDSIDRERNEIKLSEIFLTGISISRQKSRTFYSTQGLVQTLSYNTVEGAVINLNATWSKRLDTFSNSRRSISITPEMRYGFSNHYFNANLSAAYSFGKKLFNSINISGGSDVFQFNNAAPVGVFGSTLGALFNGVNNLKIYEADYGRINFTKGIGRGATVNAGLQYQDRRPLENTTDFTIYKKQRGKFTPNYPLPRFDRNIQNHQAFIYNIGVQWQPGAKYIEYPERTVSIGSKAPTFSLRYTGAVKNILNSDVAYSKWLFAIRDEVNMKLFGSFKYHIDLGGFLNKDSVAIPDYAHYTGNMSSLLSVAYMDRFQLVPHYYFSNTASFYTLLHAEHHFNGAITNKIPGLKQLKWNLVAGVNALHI